MALDLITPSRERWAVLSTYPPTACGLATFTRSLVEGLSGLGAQVDVVRVVDESSECLPGSAAHHLVNGSAGSLLATAAVLNRYDVVLVQHEFGIFGGPDGDELLDLLARVRVPVVTVLHTVLAEPTPHQRSVLQGVMAESDVLVTMTRTAQARAIELYGETPERLRVIPHGAADTLVTQPGTTKASSARPVVLTWGLLGEGKGIEWGIEAMASLVDLGPRPLYVVAGQTHPRVLEREGERYRRRLQAAAEDFGVAGDVVFDDRYLDAAQLHRLVRSADVVLLPYDSVEQVTSGVLIEAVAARRPVVSSSFPHAIELLGDGAGLLVDRKDPAALAAALRRVLTEPGLAARMSDRSAELAPELSWRAVAGRYLEAADSLTRRAAAGRPAAHDVVAVVA